MTRLHIRNTYSNLVEPFIPLDPDGKRVSLYTCGPTVYSYAHIGNFRSFLFADVLRRVLERNGYVVRQVMNITDVGHMTQDHLADATGEDKLAKAARDLGWDPFKVAAHFEEAFARDAAALGLALYSPPDASDPELHPRATRHIPEMLAMIQTLLERGFAYVDSEGQVYFEIAKFPAYGALSGKVIDELEEGSRVAVRQEKRDPRDFALWKVDPKHLMQWDPHSPRGWEESDWARLAALVPGGIDARIKAGFPGWHIECSAMAKARLGERIDIHTGGEDNIFPHHECEIAQSFGAAADPIENEGPAGSKRADPIENEGPAGSKRADPIENEAPASFARYWVHGRHLLVDGRKMAKRDGTFFTVRDLLDPVGSGRPELAARLEALGFPAGRVPAAALRYALLANPFDAQMNFSFDLLVQAKASIDRIQSRYDRLREVAGPGEPTEALRHLCAACLRAFTDALNDNLNVPNALAAVFELVGELNQRELSPADAAEAQGALASFDDVLRILDRSERSGVVTKAQITARLERGDVEPYDTLVARAATDGGLVEGLLVLRHAARQGKDYARADAIRDELRRRGVAVDDTPHGTRWKLG
jgi:cysteinyl-tRNA synthetase